MVLLECNQILRKSQGHLTTADWEFVTGLMYNLLINSSAYLHLYNSNIALFLAGIVAVFLFLWLVL